MSKPGTTEGTPVEHATQQWLASEMIVGIAAAETKRVFAPDGRPIGMDEDTFRRIARRVKIFRWLDRLSFESFLDVGAGIDVYPYLVRQRYGVETFYSDFVHQTNLPTEPELGKLDHAVTLNAVRLPFRDGAFDVVLASEVLEHLVRPVEVVAELCRVARRYVIVTSLEALSTSRWEQWWSHHRVDVREPHVERNFLLLEELRAIFGRDAVHENLTWEPSMPAHAFAPAAERERAFALNDIAALEAALRRTGSETRHGSGAMGVLIIRVQPGAPPPDPPCTERDAELVHWLVERAAAMEEYVQLVLAVTAVFQRRPETRPTDLPTPDRPVAPALLERLACPDCRRPLLGTAGGVRCTGCTTFFPADHGVPILYPRDPDRLDLEEVLDRLCGTDGGQRRIVRRVMSRLRRNEAPPSKLRRTAWRIERALGIRAR